ncbi:hypothetical protein [Agrilutibacter solisilvae]|uniref:Lipoprotein n=1 Tax=Agrilutibacter solisilvae TaxID=2763317 RepID=A0A975ATJ1_9GAMM|nr:hypothetical protein [Lysobacter solisilvae]QSX79882.1 hypothetical protein I8J32_008685 [Lysobacter solisilvae]
MMLTTPRARALLLSLVFALLAACASGPGGRLQVKGETEVFDMTLETPLDWARIKSHRQELWTVDGVLLNRLLVYSRVKPGEHVFQLARERRSRPDGPWYRVGMRLDELQQLVVDGLADQQWVGVDASGLRPHRFGTVEGVRFDLRMTNPDGLIYEGTAAVAEREGRLTVLVWMAPKEHYHGRDVASVNAMLDGMRFNQGAN